MKRTKDAWYVRLPNGKVFHAANTEALREHLREGRIPPRSTVRRSRHEEWVLLEWTREFADLCASTSVPTPSLPHDLGPDLVSVSASSLPEDEPATVASRLHASGLHLSRVRGLLEELHAALSSTASPKKLLVVAVAGLVVGLAIACLGLPGAAPLAGAGWFPWAFTAGALAALAFFTALLLNLAHTELSQMRPARWSDGFRGASSLTRRLLLSQGLFLGALLALVAGARWVAPWLLHEGTDRWGATGEALSALVLGLGQLLEVLVWPAALLSLLIGPVLAVEECSIATGLTRWYHLVIEHRAQVLLGQFLAAAGCLVLALPLCLPLLPLFGIPDTRFEPTANFVRTALAGVVAASLAGYLVVANLFLYLNLRYGHDSARRGS